MQIQHKKGKIEIGIHNTKVTSVSRAAVIVFGLHYMREERVNIFLPKKMRGKQEQVNQQDTTQKEGVTLTE